MLVTLVYPEADLFLPQEVEPSIQVSRFIMRYLISLAGQGSSDGGFY